MVERPISASGHVTEITISHTSRIHSTLYSVGYILRELYPLSSQICVLPNRCNNAKALRRNQSESIHIHMAQPRPLSQNCDQYSDDSDGTQCYTPE